MIITRKVLALAAFIAAAGVGPVELTRDSAQAADPQAARIETAFEVVAAMPTAPPFMLPMARKGDLLVPPGCAVMSRAARDGCVDAAYALSSTPSAVVETREGATSTLLKLDPMTLASAADRMRQP